MTVIFSSKSFKLVSLGLLSLTAIMGCSRKFSRIDSSEQGSAPITPVGQNASITFSGNGANGSSYSESAVVYVVGGNSFYTANQGSSGGFNGNIANITALAPISFTVTPTTINLVNISVVPYNSSQDPFCNGVTFTVQNGSITLQNSTSNKLTTMTSCAFKLTSSIDAIGDNQLDFTFNYTVKDWALPSTLGAGTAAQITANAIVNSGFTSVSTSLSLPSKNISDLSPILALTNLQSLYLQHNGISIIPSSISQLTNLQTLWLNNNQITTIPESIMQLANLKTILLNENSINTVSSDIFTWIKKMSYQLDGNPGFPNFGN
jgi:Leucine-rich repeat (LRR) protein